MKKQMLMINKVLVVLLIIISIINVGVILGINSASEQQKKIAAEVARPANIEIIKISSSCTDCFNIDAVIEQIKAMNVKVTTEKTVDYTAPEGYSIVNRYGIVKLPSLIITGEINKSSSLTSFWNSNGKIENNTFIFTAVKPPYTDATTNKIAGRVAVTKIYDSSCGNCTDMNRLIADLERLSVKITDKKELDYNSNESKELISKYSIKIIPTIVLSSEIAAYEDILPVILQSSTKETDSSYVMRAIMPPFRNLTSNKLEGFASLIELNDSSCSECYNVKTHESIARGFGVVLANITMYDINSSEGIVLLKKYNITKVPTILISPDADVYATFKLVWKDVGTVEKDGWFVFTHPEVFQGQKYKDLANNTVVSVP